VKKLNPSQTTWPIGLTDIDAHEKSLSRQSLATGTDN